jgi:hypothetical protein
MTHKSTVEVGNVKIGDTILYPEHFNLKGKGVLVETIEYTKTGMIKINGSRALKKTTSFYED